MQENPWKTHRPQIRKVSQVCHQFERARQKKTQTQSQQCPLILCQKVINALKCQNCCTKCCQIRKRTNQKKACTQKEKELKSRQVIKSTNRVPKLIFVHDEQPNPQTKNNINERWVTRRLDKEKEAKPWDLYPEWREQFARGQEVERKEGNCEDDAAEGDEEHSAWLPEFGCGWEESDLCGDNCAAVVETEESETVLWALCHSQGVAGVFF